MPQTKHYVALNWDQPFDPLFGSPLILPRFTTLWRGIDLAYAAISERPSYYSSQSVANGYALKPNTKLRCFITTRPLHILDVRFMKSLLSRLIQQNQTSPHIHEFKPVIMSFGICSLSHQIGMLKEHYAADPVMMENVHAVEATYRPDPIIEQGGIRVGETCNDGATMAFLKELFKGKFDGYLAPRMQTSFHVTQQNTIPPELLLFNPIDAEIVEVPYEPIPRPVSNTEIFQPINGELGEISLRQPSHRISPMDIMHHQYEWTSVGQSPLDLAWFYGKHHGGGRVSHPLDEYHSWVQRTKRGKAHEARWEAAGRRWRSAFRIGDRNGPGPTSTVRSTSSYTPSAHWVAGARVEMGY
jgi:hypothetical protein